jgi:hypothetical protein
LVIGCLPRWFGLRIKSFYFDWIDTCVYRADSRTILILSHCQRHIRQFSNLLPYRVHIRRTAFPRWTSEQHCFWCYG